jgi:tRNA pseudouridine32 synthase/23S rRNA pseudouridine746 synthase
MEIIFIDPLFVIINKPSGLLSVPGRDPEMQDCAVNRIKALFPDCIDQPAVHRLDMDTSGLMAVARTSMAHRNLSLQFANQRVEKRYIALLEGIPTQQSGEIALPFRLDTNNRPHQIHDPLHGKMGITRWRLIAIEGNRSRIEFTPLTGRTHQLRLHAAHPLGMGIPIVGDRLYGSGTRPGELLLHATSLSLRHPVSDERMTWQTLPSF